MQLKFSANIFLTLLFTAISFSMSYWQWNRHTEKKAFVLELNNRLQSPIIPIQNMPNLVDGQNIEYRRVTVEGTYDFDHEIVLRNRRYEKLPGVYVLTPLKLENAAQLSGSYILVQRGFSALPYSEKQDRLKISRPTGKQTFTALIKKSQTRPFFGPSDNPTGKDLPWVDSWLRPDLENIEKQLPYNLLNIYLEVIPEAEKNRSDLQILHSDAGREEMFYLGERKMDDIKGDADAANPAIYPIATYSTVIPPFRHFGYIFEWAFIGIVVLVVGCFLELRRL